MVLALEVKRLPWVLATFAAILFAGWIVVDTLRSLVPYWSPLPWFDEWATVELLRAWQAGEMTVVQVLFAQHNEHRLVVPRILFFADDVFFRGGGWLEFIAICVVQASHAALFATVLFRSKGAGRGRWIVAAICVALMFSLRQVENLGSPFQLQFVAVFAGATLSFVVFGLAIARMRREAPFAGCLLASFATILLTVFTMANGLVAAFVLVAMARTARVRWSVVLACAAWAAILTMIYFHGYEPVAQHSRPLDSLHRPGELLLYAAMYLGSVIATGDVLPAAVLGFVGMAATLAAAVRCHLQRGGRLMPLAMVAVMLFVMAAALVTASGRLTFGLGQALSSRYVAGSVTFWAAHLVYWWIDPPAWPSRRSGIAASRRAVLLGSFILVLVLPTEQRQAKGPLAEQRFAQNESADLLMLGLDDRAVVTRAAWSDEDVERLVPVLRRNRISIFGTRDFEALGHPLADRAIRDNPDLCGGAIDVAEADASLGHDGVRLSGTAWDGAKRRLVRRVFLTDKAGVVVGFGSGAEPGAARSAWRGFAVAPLGSRLVAYGLLSDGHVCRVGAHGVSERASHTSRGAAPS